MKFYFNVLGLSTNSYKISDLSEKTLYKELIKRSIDSSICEKYFLCDPANIALCFEFLSIIDDITIFPKYKTGIFIFTDHGISIKQNEYLSKVRKGMNSSIHFRQTTSNLLSTILSIVTKSNDYTITGYLIENNYSDYIFYSMLEFLNNNFEIAIISFIRVDKQKGLIYADLMVLSDPKLKLYPVENIYFEYTNTNINQFELLNIETFFNDLIFRKGIKLPCNNGILKVDFT